MTDSRIVALGDIGGIGGYHVGDEAMFEAALSELRARGISRWTALSGDPAETAARYGIDALPQFGFASLRTATERDSRLRDLLADPTRPDAFDRDDPALRIRDALTASAAAIITGGGNLDANWPHHVYERAALAGMARALGARVVVTGQGIGPNLDRRTGELVSSIVGGADLVSVRDQISLDVIGQLGHHTGRVHLVADDAAFLPGRPRPDLLATLGVVAGRFVAATFSAYSGVLDPEDHVAELVRLLDSVADAVGLPIVLIPHHGRSGTDPDGDVALHARLARSTGAVMAELPVLSARDTAWITGQAALVVANRYHPVVFGVSNGVPAVGVAVDEYTHRKISGALELYGSSDWCLPAVGLADDLVQAAVVETWSRRAEITEHLGQQYKTALTASSNHWDAVATVIAGGRPMDTARIPPVTAMVPGVWAEPAAVAHRWSDRLARRDAARRRELDDGRARIGELEAAARVNGEQSAVARDRMTLLQRMVESEQDDAEAARDLAGESLERWTEVIRQKMVLDGEIAAVLEELAEAHLGRAEQTGRIADLEGKLARSTGLVAGLTAQVAELHALQQTKLLRWTRTPRKYYSMIRRGLGLQ